MRLRALAPGKVNLCLLLGATRPQDGRHELVTLFESLSLADDLTLEPAAQDAVVCPGVLGENLALAAIRGLRERGWDGPPVRITIAKRIPVAAGLAGGSTDAAAALRLAAALVPADPALLAEVAASLGADVPSQLNPGLSLGTGAGEVVRARAALAPHAFVLLPSIEQLSTAAVYREADRLGLARSAAELHAGQRRLDAALTPGARLAGELVVNDLTAAALSLCPSIARALRDVREKGAEQAILCGSGPTVAGVFWGDAGEARAAQAAASLSAGHPDAVAVTPVRHPFGAVTAL